ncbi:hypothetical protein WOLCODRAFT_16056 [Wolfiporia cocos MD-104 SS10]|uniref:Uncharacterized protein n=1 Tax=Wolfiporia cocos (strain MD-104) TaxID=742152 RepID=A0A2H3J950_WOLCO|nr:hypothetical protein WOLCODRAFT_16056 [Wolfiporia cocos MD-104 SS10]
MSAASRCKGATNRWKRSTTSSRAGISDLLGVDARLCRWPTGAFMLLPVFGQSLVILSSTDVIAELLENRSAIYSDNGRVCRLHNHHTVQYGSRLRESRKIMIGKPNPWNAHMLKEMRAIHLLTKSLRQFCLHSSSEVTAEVATRFVASAAFQITITYGYNFKHLDDQLVQWAGAE